MDQEPVVGRVLELPRGTRVDPELEGLAADPGTLEPGAMAPASMVNWPVGLDQDLRTAQMYLRDVSGSRNSEWIQVPRKQAS